MSYLRASDVPSNYKNLINFSQYEDKADQNVITEAATQFKELKNSLPSWGYSVRKATASTVSFLAPMAASLALINQYSEQFNWNAIIPQNVKKSGFFEGLLATAYERSGNLDQAIKTTHVTAFLTAGLVAGVIFKLSDMLSKSVSESYDKHLCDLENSLKSPKTQVIEAHKKIYDPLGEHILNCLREVNYARSPSTAMKQLHTEIANLRLKIPYIQKVFASKGLNAVDSQLILEKYKAAIAEVEKARLEVRLGGVGLDFSALLLIEAPESVAVQACIPQSLDDLLKTAEEHRSSKLPAVRKYTMSIMAGLASVANVLCTSALVAMGMDKMSEALGGSTHIVDKSWALATLSKWPVDDQDGFLMIGAVALASLSAYKGVKTFSSVKDRHDQDYADITKAIDEKLGDAQKKLKKIFTAIADKYVREGHQLSEAETKNLKARLLEFEKRLSQRPGLDANEILAPVYTKLAKEESKFK